MDAIFSLKRFTNLDEFEIAGKRVGVSPKNVTLELVKKYPLRVEIYDVLMLEDQELLSAPLKKRRAILEKNIVESKHFGLFKQWTITNAKELKELYQWAIDNKYEGLVGKDPDSFYVPDSKDEDQLKLKEFFTVDLAVLGFYETESSIKNNKPFSAVLVGSYNFLTKEFESMTKIKIGKVSDQEKIYNALSTVIRTDSDYQKALKANPRIVFNPVLEKKSYSEKVPNQVVKYTPGEALVIIEVKTQNVTLKKNWSSCGLTKEGLAHSLRVPTLVRIREDKTKPEDITTTEQIQKYFFG